MHKSYLSKSTSNMDHRIILPVHFIQLEIYGELLSRMEVAVPRSLRSKQQKGGNCLLKIKAQKEKVNNLNKIINSLEHLKAAVTLRALKTAKKVFCNKFMESKKSFRMTHFVTQIGKEHHINNTKITSICQRKQQQVEGKQVLGNRLDQAGIEI